jgi:hypothetical protein
VVKVHSFEPALDASSGKDEYCIGTLQRLVDFKVTTRKRQEPDRGDDRHDRNYDRGPLHES